MVLDFSDLILVDVWLAEKAFEPKEIELSVYMRKHKTRMITRAFAHVMRNCRANWRATLGSSLERGSLEYVLCVSL